MKLAKTFICACLFSGLVVTQAKAGPRTYDLDHYGVELSIDVMRMPIFPSSMISSGYFQGVVHIAFEVDNHGELRDWIVLEATHPDFVKALSNVIDSWKFSAPYVNGENRSVVGQFTVNFHSSNSVISFDTASSALNARVNELTGYRGRSSKVARAQDLDTVPYPIVQPRPSVPKDLIEKHNGAKALFTFYVDEAGDVRIPALVQTDGSPELGMVLAAQDALTQWKFEPPTKNSRPVKVKLSQEFVFTDR